MNGHGHFVYDISVELDVMTLSILEQTIPATLRQFFVSCIACDLCRGDSRYIKIQVFCKYAGSRTLQVAHTSSKFAAMQEPRT